MYIFRRRSLEVVSRRTSNDNEYENDDSKRHSLTSTAPKPLSQKKEENVTIVKINYLLNVTYLIVA